MSEVKKQPARGRVHNVRRYVVRRMALAVALLILFYATSLHGFSLRTLVLVGILVLALYGLFHDRL